MDKRITVMEKLGEKLLGAQKRADGSSNAHHAKRVRALLISALAQANETPSSEKMLALECAALGHDFLEDSKISQKELLTTVGQDSLRYIKELTNTWGDSHTGPYVDQVVRASEEARLIKYADLTDNIFHASYQIALLGIPWMENFFLPIVDPMRAALEKTAFSAYPKTASLLRSSTTLARAHLAQNIEQNKTG